MRVLVTGANGFVGRWLVRHLSRAGQEVVALAGPSPVPGAAPPGAADGVVWRPFDLEDPAGWPAALAGGADAVIHLAGRSSVAESLADPVAAWRVNAVGTARFLEALAGRRAGGEGPVVLLVSTGEVYGRGNAPHREDDPPAPVSPYGASKAAAELAGLETWRRTGLRVMVARPFPHTGPGQSDRFVVPALLGRVRQAARQGRSEIPVGNLSPVRDFLDVEDVVAAYVRLLEAGTPGRVYNVASGTGLRLEDLLQRIAALVGHPVRPVPDPALLRPADIPVLVGNADRLQAETGWRPAHALDDTLRRMLDAETD